MRVAVVATPERVRLRAIGRWRAPSSAIRHVRNAARSSGRGSCYGWRKVPPKVVWIRLGNCTTRQVAALLRDRAADVAAFVAEDEAGFLALG
jgi:hypothetical protein